MIESTHTLMCGITVDLHYLLAIQPEKGTCFVDLQYQLLPKPARLKLGVMSGRFNKEEQEQELAALKGAWKIYKREHNR